ncbi:hypothetical protein MMC10_002800 [Thelotrema lepadinum]|nr:hypothetical protein [Thelotrema lepadinum]
MTSSTLQLALLNQTTSGTVYAYITGQAVDNNNALVLIQADGKTPYYPGSPSRNGTSLAQNCAIRLGAPGSTTNVTIPRIAGGRVWFSIGNTLTFLLNPGPGLVEPTVANPNDPNINIQWDFCEFTFNQSQLYANISYVDFVSVPIGMTLLNSANATQHVSGLPQNGLNEVISGLQAQDSSDHAGWSQLVVTGPNGNLRVLSPNTGIGNNSALFSGYYEPYVNQVYSQYQNQKLTIDTQGQWGNVTGQVSGGELTFAGVGSFAKPSTANIFSNSSGPFATSTVEMGDIGARLAAAFNRSTLLIDSNQPESENPANYYKNSITNHYARILHAANLDGRGYAFPYDDVAPSGGKDQSGFFSDGNPKLWTIAVGGGNATAQKEAQS